MMMVLGLHPRAEDFIGYIPTFLDENDARPAKEQFASKYIGGWQPMQGWSFEEIGGGISYPGDPPLLPMAAMVLRDEVILVYPHSWVLILQRDNSFEIARMD